MVALRESVKRETLFSKRRRKRAFFERDVVFRVVLRDDVGARHFCVSNR